jgi:hypothetical protein
MSALQARAETLGAVFRARELKTLEDLKSKLVTRMDALRDQAAANHAESLDQLAGVHAKLDEFSGAGLSILRAMESGETMPRTDEQSDAARIRQLRTLKQLANNEISELQEAENVRKAARLAGIRQGAEVAAVHAAALHQDIAGLDVDGMDPGEAFAKIKEWEESQKKIAQGLRKDVKAAAKAKAKGKAKARGKGKARAAASSAASSAAAVAPDIDDASPRSSSSSASSSTGAASSAAAAAPAAAPAAAGADVDDEHRASAADPAAASSDADDECGVSVASASAGNQKRQREKDEDDGEPLVRHRRSLRDMLRENQEKDELEYEAHLARMARYEEIARAAGGGV